jgi:hypothetical protein
METDIEIRIKTQNYILCKKFYYADDHRLIGNFIRCWKDGTLHYFAIPSKEGSMKFYIYKNSNQQIFGEMSDGGNEFWGIQNYKDEKLYGKSIGRFPTNF